MSNESQAEIWYTTIKTEYPEIYNKLSLLGKNDSLGSPPMWTSFDGIRISPNTLRYVNTVIQIQDYFNFCNPIVVSQLGVGYGGLCYIMSCLLSISRYNLLDLPQVQELSMKYLKDLEVPNVYTDICNSDLFVSEWCLSQFDELDLYKFYENYVCKCRNVYLSMNLHDQYRKQKFLTIISKDYDIVVRDEYPKTQWPNYIILGKIKQVDNNGV